MLNSRVKVEVETGRKFVFDNDAQRLCHFSRHGKRAEAVSKNRMKRHNVTVLGYAWAAELGRPVKLSRLE